MTNAEIAVPESLSSGSTARDLTREFYKAVLSAAEQTALEVAEEMDGLDRELATLRVKLRKIMKRRTSKEQLEREDSNIKLLIRAMDSLNRLLSTRYRISKKSQVDLAASIAGILNSARAELGYGEIDGT